MLKLFSMIKSRLKAHNNNKNNSIYDSNNPLPPQPSCKEIQTEWEAWMMRKGLSNRKLEEQTCSTSSLIMEADWATAGINIFAQFPIKSRSPLVDLCVNRSQVGLKKVQIGDMELGGGSASLGGMSSTQFKSIDEVQSMIRHLQKIEQDMKKDGDGGDENNTKSLVSFESLALLDEREVDIDENETEWLTKVPGSKKMTAKDLEGDESFIDSGLLNVRHGLLNFVKSVVIEEKATKFNASPRYHPPQNNTVLNSNTFCRRKTPPSPLNTTVPLRAMSPPTVYHTYSPKRPALAGLLADQERRLLLAQEGRLLIAQEARLVSQEGRLVAQEGRLVGQEGSSENSPVSSSSAHRSSFEFLSPNAQKSIREDRNDLVEANLYFSTPAVKQIDSRTYTRPKKNRLPLETYHDDLPVSPIKPAGLAEEVLLDDVVEPFEMDEDHHQMNNHANMNETFVAAEDDIVEETHLVHNHHHHHHHLKAQEESPPRRVTRNLSYVIRRESESPNNNSPVHPSENIENIAVDLNSTFVRTREGTYSPSPTGSNTSIHTSSMEELHNLARIQEQSLRMSSNPKMLTRKDTHTLVRGSEQPTLRPINKPPMESQIPSQPKLRIQSRIPALGAAGSRIRPPVNGTTRRPITSGGIRRAPDWRDDGAY